MAEKTTTKGTFVINRKRWVTGEANTCKIDSMLYDPDTKLMCCLGQAARQLGFKANEIAGYGNPDDLIVQHDLGRVLGDVSRRKIELLKLAGFVVGNEEYVTDTKAVRDLININDDTRLTRKQREQKIAAGFRKIGWRVRFTGEYPNYERMAKRRGLL